MPYQYDLSPGQKIYLDNPGHTTVITLASGGPGQQQQSGTQVQTGPWTEMPQAAAVGSTTLIRCVTAQGIFVWQVQGMQVGTADAALWPIRQAVPMQPVAANPSVMQPMWPMQPMTPMKMGDMQMSTNPMTMRMGDMALSMGAANPPDAKLFCTQCGAAAAPGDRFCGSCGHQLQP